MTAATLARAPLPQLWILARPGGAAGGPPGDSPAAVLDHVNELRRQKGLPPIKNRRG